MFPSEVIWSRIGDVKERPTPAKIAPNGTSVMHDTMNENATTPVMHHATYAVATPRWARMSPVDWVKEKNPKEMLIGSEPKKMIPTTSPVTTTRNTATHAQNTATKNFAKTRRPRATGRMRM